MRATVISAVIINLRWMCREAMYRIEENESEMAGLGESLHRHRVCHGVCNQVCLQCACSAWVAEFEVG